MQKRLLVCVLSVAMLCASFSAFAACAKPHEHEFSSEWTSGERGHWHECECGEKSDFADHVWENDGSCETCGYSIFGGTYEEITLEQAKNFAGKLQNDGKSFDWKEGYQTSAGLDVKGFRKNENDEITPYRAEMACSVYTGEKDGDTVAQALSNVTITYEEGLLEQVSQTEAWYQGAYAFIETVSFNEKPVPLRYKEKISFDEYLLQYGHSSSRGSDLMTYLQMLGGNFYKDVSVYSSKGEMYQKYKLEVPRQGDGEVENALTVIFVYDKENALCACEYAMEQYITLPTTGVGAGEGVTENIAKYVVVPYAGTVEPPDDPGSFPEKSGNALFNRRAV